MTFVYSCRTSSAPTTFLIDAGGQKEEDRRDREKEDHARQTDDAGGKIRKMLVKRDLVDDVRHPFGVDVAREIREAVDQDADADRDGRGDDLTFRQRRDEHIDRDHRPSQQQNAEEGREEHRPVRRGEGRDDDRVQDEDRHTEAEHHERRQKLSENDLKEIHRSGQKRLLGFLPSFFGERPHRDQRHDQKDHQKHRGKEHRHRRGVVHQTVGVERYAREKPEYGEDDIAYRRIEIRAKLSFEYRRHQSSPPSVSLRKLSSSVSPPVVIDRIGQSARASALNTPRRTSVSVSKLTV